jgi:hypothetical protein
MLRVVAALPAAAVLALSSVFSLQAGRADAWPPLPTAGPFLTTQIHDLARGRYALAWSRLYPAHQAMVPQAVYVACEKALPFVAPPKNEKVVRVRRVAVAVPGAPTPVPGVAVTMRIAVKWYGRDPLTFVHTFHLVPVGGRWTWILSPQRYRLYESSGCGFKPHE